MVSVVTVLEAFAMSVRETISIEIQTSQSESFEEFYLV